LDSATKEEEVEEYNFWTVTKYDTTLTFYKVRNLSGSIKTFFPDALLDIRLADLKLDWPLHGWKRLVSNFITTLYNSWKAKLDNPLHKEELANFEHQMRLYVDTHFVVPENNLSIKLNGTEARKFSEFNVPIICSLAGHADILVYEVFIALKTFYELIKFPRSLKELNGGKSYIEALEFQEKELLFKYAKRFGTDSIKKKKYMHNIQHVHELEKFALLEGSATLEEFTMEGREHANCVFSSYYQSKFGMPETKQRGRKFVVQKAKERVETANESAYENTMKFTYFKEAQDLTNK